MATATAGSSGIVRGDFWRCVRCGSGAHPSASGDRLDCPACGAVYPVVDGVVIVSDQTTDNNEVVKTFYNGPLWPKFRFWEWLTFATNGGERRSRNKVLDHLPKGEDLRVLDIAIGDGVYLPWLPPSWSVVGVDISRVQLDACKARAGDRDLTLVMGEAEKLPVVDHSFDACLSIGGFNYFNDPEGSLREMARAVKPGGTIVISDEVPNLTNRLPFRYIGLPGIDKWILSRTMHLGDEFTDIVERLRKLDVAAIGRDVLPGSTYKKIWMGVGYVLVGKVPG